MFPRRDPDLPVGCFFTHNDRLAAHYPLLIILARMEVVITHTVGPRGTNSSQNSVLDMPYIQERESHSHKMQEYRFKAVFNV